MILRSPHICAWPGVFVQRLLLATLFLVIGGCSSDEAVEAVVEQQNPVPAQWSALYVFGDSLSDMGNLGDFLLFGADLPEPFFENRITNGPVIVEYAAERLGVELKAALFTQGGQSEGTNYAVSGAQAEAGGNFDLGVQLAAFTAASGGVAPDDAFYILFIGGNDILEVRDRVESEAEAELLLSVDAIVANAERLVTLGARHLAYFTVPDIGRTPKVLMEAQTDPGRSERASRLTVFFNAAVQRGLADSSTLKAARVQVVDIYGLATNLLDDPASAGLTNTTEACFDSDLQDFAFSPACGPNQLDQFFYFDDLHPSGRTHQLIGQEAASQLPTSGGS